MIMIFIYYNKKKPEVGKLPAVFRILFCHVKNPFSF